jgi:hypothetical protein
MNEERKALIEKMKKNLAKYGNLCQIEKALLKEIGRNNCQYLEDNGVWCDTCSSNTNEYISSNRYRIKPDYQEPEPKQKQEEYYEIQLSKTDYPEYYVVIDGRMFKLYEIQYMPMYDNCYVKSNNEWVSINEAVARICLNKGQKVYIKIKR